MNRALHDSQIYLGVLEAYMAAPFFTSLWYFRYYAVCYWVFFLGEFLLIPGHSAIRHALIMQSGAIILPNASPSDLINLPLKQFVSTFLWSIPLTTWFQPVCSISDPPYFGSGTSLTLSCSLLQGTWSTGYVLLLGMGLLLAGSAYWNHWKQQRAQGKAFTPEEQQK
jgi:hypothetical protein